MFVRVKLDILFDICNKMSQKQFIVRHYASVGNRYFLIGRTSALICRVIRFLDCGLLCDSTCFMCRT